jgi:hypothetical protein
MVCSASDRQVYFLDATAGIAGGIAFLAVQAIDLKIFRNRTNDLILLGGVVSSNRAVSIVSGLIMHFSASAAMGLAHGVIVRRLGTRPGWMSGLALAMVENAALYPVLMIENLHPARRRGELDSYLRPVPVVQELARHTALGVAMGIVAGFKKH